MKKSNEFFLLSLVVLVIMGAVLVIFTSTKRVTPVEATVEGAKTTRVETSAELMKMLQSTVDDEGKADFVQLRKDASGL